MGERGDCGRHLTRDARRFCERRVKGLFGWTVEETSGEEIYYFTFLFTGKNEIVAGRTFFYSNAVDLVLRLLSPGCVIYVNYSNEMCEKFGRLHGCLLNTVIYGKLLVITTVLWKTCVIDITDNLLFYIF